MTHLTHEMSDAFFLVIECMFDVNSGKCGYHTELLETSENFHCALGYAFFPLCATGRGGTGSGGKQHVTLFSDNFFCVTLTVTFVPLDVPCCIPTVHWDVARSPGLLLTLNGQNDLRQSCGLVSVVQLVTWREYQTMFCCSNETKRNETKETTAEY